MKNKHNSNNESNFKKLPKNIKLATFNSNNEEDILLEILIANMIHNGASFNSLFKPIELIENEKEKEGMKNKVTNIVLDFIDLNPRYIGILKQNHNVSEFLNSFGVDFII